MSIAVVSSPTIVSAAPAAPSTRRSLFAATHLAAQSLILNILSLPAMAYIVHRLGASNFGLWNTAAALVATTAVIGNLGLRGTFVRAVACDPKSAPTALAEQLGLRLGLSLLAGAAALGIACALPRYPAVVAQCVAVGCAGLFLTTFASSLQDLLQGMHRISVYAGTNFVAGLVLTAASVLAVWRGAGPVGLSAAYVLGPAASAVLLAVVVRRSIGPIRVAWNVRRFVVLLRDARFFAAQQFVAAISEKAESLLLPLLVPAAMFGYFSAGLLLATRLVVIPDGLGSAFYPVVAQSYAQDRQRAGRDVGRFLVLSVVICLPVVIGVMAIARPVAAVLFPGHVEVCAMVMRITIWSLPLMAIENVMGYALNAAGQDASQARRHVGWALANLTVAVALVLRFGVLGACCSFVLRTAIKIGFVARLFARTFSPQLPGMMCGKAICSALAMAAGMWLVARLAPVAVVHREAANVRQWAMLLAVLGVQGAVGAGVYALSLLGLRVLRPADLASLLRRR